MLVILYPDVTDYYLVRKTIVTLILQSSAQEHHMVQEIGDFPLPVRIFADEEAQEGTFLAFEARKLLFRI